MLISVIVPMKNAAPYVRECLQSILAEKSVPIETIVVDDQSSDDSRSIVSGIRDGCLRVIDGPGTGIADCLNAGLQRARGSIIMRCDADDAYPDGRIAEQAYWLDQLPDFDAICGAFTTIDRRGKTLLKMHADGDEAIDITDEILSGTVRTHLCTFAIRRPLVDRLGGFHSFFKTGEDVDYQLRMSELGRIAYVPMNWYRYRIHGDSITHVVSDERRKYYEDVARSLQIHRRYGHTNGLAELEQKPPREFSNALLTAEAHTQGLLLGRAWQLHSGWSKGKALLTGLRAVAAQPSSRSAWKSLAALAWK